MIGQQSGIQEQLFFGFSFENHIPKDHLLRGINHFLDLGDFRQLNHPSANGRSVPF
ncbi:hypothetical protein IVG45_07275 [Methylomonas sp. LL1]|uniref:hypothetical protein n=1 Tax=Methylomonas sp. LL1 TaxID=2785785 RepID=UPI0018C38B0A|nr:hypothetical protein [Methylomonas sp. LL1]QPK64742.1 hypothetical protein IVG45_07275 [Methylomonas sp. LL1]